VECGEGCPYTVEETVNVEMAGACTRIPGRGRRGSLPVLEVGLESDE
jgi:hypothetical protein